jgi:hypothetical protein
MMVLFWIEETLPPSLTSALENVIGTYVAHAIREENEIIPLLATIDHHVQVLLLMIPLKNNN